MDLRNAPITAGTTETHNFSPPPAQVSEEKEVFEEEPFKFPPMVKDDAARPSNPPDNNIDVSAKSDDAGDKTAAVGRRQAVPKMDFGPIPGEYLPEVGIDFGEMQQQTANAEAARQLVKSAAVSHDAPAQDVSGQEELGRVRVTDAGSFEKNFEEYLRRKNAERAGNEPESKISKVSDIVESADGLGPQAPRTSEHDMFSDPSGQKGAGEDNGATERNGVAEQNGVTERPPTADHNETPDDFPSLVHGVESNPAFKRLEEARQKIEAAQIKTFRETQGEFRGSITDSDKYLEDTFKSFNFLMSDGMVRKSADDARKELLTQHAGLESSLDGVPGEQLREQIATLSLDYLYGDPQHRDAILETMRRAGVSPFADGLKGFGETLERLGPVLKQEARVTGSLRKAFNESYSMRTIYGESISHAMNHVSTPATQKDVDRQEIEKIAEEQRSMVEHYRMYLDVPEVYLELRARKNPEGVIEANLRDGRQIA